jgi:uncharacterized protein YjbJ (UPF0337 family)
VHRNDLKSRWEQVEADVRRRWDKLTAGDLQAAEGESGELAVRIQQKYGVTWEEANRQIDEFCSAY